MTRCRTGDKHFLNERLPSSLASYDVTRIQQVKNKTYHKNIARHTAHTIVSWHYNVPEPPARCWQLTCRSVLVCSGMFKWNICISYLLILLIVTSLLLQKKHNRVHMVHDIGYRHLPCSNIFVFIAQIMDVWTLFAITNTFYFGSVGVSEYASSKTSNSIYYATRHLTARSGWVSIHSGKRD